ncbi:MAG: hypothetical protein MJ208_04070, partial [Bacilli bacterium]|nr:hypothetical protein [Bacilli bacterium]
KMIPNIVSQGLTIVLNDKKGDIGVAYLTTTDFKHLHHELDNYAYGVINLKKTYDHILREELVRNILVFMEKIRMGGKIYISERSINLFPYGLDGMKIMLKIAKFTNIVKKEKYLVAEKE